jgi:electron transfer flavoprotein beta subunit
VLGIPFVGGVKSLQPNETEWHIQRLLDDWEESWDVRTPAALTIHARAFKPRSIALTRIARAYDHLEVETWSLAQIGLTAEQTGLAGSPTRVADLKKLKRNRTCRMIEGEPREQVESLIEHLRTKGIIGS